MNTRITLLKRSLLVIGMLILASLACVVGAEDEKTATPTSEIQVTPPVVVATEAAQQQPLVNTGVDIRKLEAATVQVLMEVDDGRGGLTVYATGSGTIVSPDGLILTNAHVADPAAPGLAAFYQSTDLLFFPKIEQLVIAMVTSEDQPPDPKYIAEVAAVDGTIDLAVIRITHTVDGDPIRSGDLNLPYVPLGDSDTVKIGDIVHVFGFPGIGGNTITYTRGIVSGFEAQDRVGNRAWIKTDTAIAHGNSGGLAANEANEIIGVPSRGVSEEGTSINRLMTINLAKALVDAAKNNQTYESPYLVKGTGKQRFDLVSWSQDYDEKTGCPVGEVVSYPSGAPVIISVFSYQNMSKGEDFAFLFKRDGELVGSSVYAWDGGARGDCYYLYYYTNGDPLPDGSYTVDLYAGENLNRVGHAETAVGKAVSSNQQNNNQPGSANMISVSGRVVDADSGNPIEGAAVLVLYPGTDIQKFLSDPKTEDIYTSTLTDKDGYYWLPGDLEKGVKYPVIAGAYDQGYQLTYGTISYPTDGPDKATLNIKLGK